MSSSTETLPDLDEVVAFSPTTLDDHYLISFTLSKGRPIFRWTDAPRIFPYIISDHVKMIWHFYSKSWISNGSLVNGPSKTLKSNNYDYYWDGNKWYFKPPKIEGLIYIRDKKLYRFTGKNFQVIGRMPQPSLFKDISSARSILYESKQYFKDDIDDLVIDSGSSIRGTFLRDIGLLNKNGSSDGVVPANVTSYLRNIFVKRLITTTGEDSVNSKNKLKIRSATDEESKMCVLKRIVSLISYEKGGNEKTIVIAIKNKMSNSSHYRFTIKGEWRFPSKSISVPSIVRGRMNSNNSE
jgi:hypothetical protein